MNLSILIIFLSILSVYSEQNVNKQQIIPTVIQAQAKVNQKIDPVNQYKQQFQIQTKKQGEQNQILNQQLPSYIKEQINQFTAILQLPITQTFNFLVKPQEQVIFKWDPSKNKQLKLIVDIFQIGSSGDVKAILDAEQFQFVQILTKNPSQISFTSIGKVYRTKLFTIDFDTDFKYLKFINKNTETVLIQINIETLNFVVQKGVPDDQLTLSRNKMYTILMESQSTEVQRQHVYKWQWGYLQNQKQHQIQILGFTGIQLFAIILTSCVQMGLLKSLLDNRAVV